MEYPWCKQRITKVSLAEILRCFEHPISEEQAWAICFQCCCKMEQLAQGLYPLLHSVFIKGPGSIFIHADGTASFKVYPKSGKCTDVGSIQHSEDKLLECLGVVIYEALDWGIDSQAERELSDHLEKLLCLMLKLDNEAMKPAATLQDVIKVCEEHLSRPSEATSYYKMTCGRLFTEYVELQKLVTIIQTSKEVRLGSPFSSADLSLTGVSQASLWPSIIHELENGVRLRKATERSRRHLPPKESILSPYELLLDDIQHKRYTLRKVSNWNNAILSPVVFSFYPLSLSGAMPCLQLLERKLKECVPLESRWDEHLMTDIKQQQKLQSAATRGNGSRPKGTCH
ncbi:SPIR1 protein, partial [Oreotrochilus melanogaster]|nr:SPIR1 protein [Oreotrochilus melanogaster]